MESSTAELLKQLVETVGTDWVKTDTDDLQHYGKDWTSVFQPDPVAIVFPSSIEEVQQVVRLARENQVALVPSGGRTGLSGGAVAEHQ